MTYLAWNSKIGEHFFGEGSGGRRVVLCVTRDTLAEVSGMPPEDSLKDFIAAVLEGPEFNRIRGCTFLETKVHCCLHVDPQWGLHWSEDRVNPSRVAELQDLSGHVYWADYILTKLDDDHPDRYPPYLAYLAAFVLAWTERDSDYNGNDYYDPLLDLLDGQSRWPTRPAFGRPYLFKGFQYSMNDVWKDLMRFCEANSRAELILPDTVVRPGRYVDTPKFFGLMKASDLRNLDKLFVAMEEARQLRPDFVPTARELVGRVARFDQTTTYLSNTCLNNLKSAVNADDASLAEAFGRLLQSKYRDFDGLPDQDDQAEVEKRRRTARLLRMMDRNGTIKLVCRLRSETALKKLALEEDADYLFTRDEIELSTRWISGSEWFSPMKLPILDPMGELALECPALRINANMSAKSFVVMHSPGLYFLAGCKVEVDEVEKGRQYVLLVRGNEAPVLDGIQLVRMYIPCPQGLSCWSFSVPMGSSPEGWPDILPPLHEERSPKPRLSFSGFRLEPRITRFPVGLPVRIRCNVDNVELVAAGDIDEDGLQKEDDGVWVLKAQQPGDITLSLCNSESQLAPEGWMDQEITLEHLHDEGTPPRDFGRKLIDEAVSLPYPEALIDLVGGVLDPRGDQGVKTYFATVAPSVRVTTKNLYSAGGLRVLLGGKPCAIAQDGSHILPTPEAGQRLIFEVNDGEVLLISQQIAFSREPEIQVKCASRDPSKPLDVPNTLVATIRGEAGLAFDWEVRSGETRQTGGQTSISGSGTWEGVLLARDDAGLDVGKTYEVRFGFAGRFTVSRWFKFRGRGPSGGAGKGTGGNPTSGGFNSLGNAFRGGSLPGEKKGGKR